MDEGVMMNGQQYYFIHAEDVESLQEVLHMLRQLAARSQTADGLVCSVLGERLETVISCLAA